MIAVPEHSHTGESQSNGAAGRAVQMFEDQTRTLKSALEEHIGWEIPVDHPLFGWILHHAAFLLTKFHVGNDGLTGYQRLHGKGSLDRVAEFGERVMWYVPVKRRLKHEPKWRNGIFVGRSWNSDQNYVALMDGSITRARAMVRVVPSRRWDLPRLQRVSGTLCDLAATCNLGDVEALPDPHRGPVQLPDDGPEVDDHVGVRRIPILPRGLANHGCSDDCTRCRYKGWSDDLGP